MDDNRLIMAGAFFAVRAQILGRLFLVHVDSTLKKKTLPLLFKLEFFIGRTHYHILTFIELSYIVLLLTCIIFHNRIIFLSRIILRFLFFSFSCENGSVGLTLFCRLGLFCCEWALVSTSVCWSFWKPIWSATLLVPSFSFIFLLWTVSLRAPGQLCLFSRLW